VERVDQRLVEYDSDTGALHSVRYPEMTALEAAAAKAQFVLWLLTTSGLVVLAFRRRK
jgi:hypothetical protein